MANHRSALMKQTYLSSNQPRTHFLWWCAAVICSIITIGVIIAGIAVFVGYLVIHPRVPVISVVDAHLDHFQYDPAGILITQVNIVVRSGNDNLKAHASFSDFSVSLFFDGIQIAILSADPYEVSKNSSVDFNFVATSEPIPLNPAQMDDVDMFLKQDRVRFDLNGKVRARWKVGIFGSVKFLLHLNCQLYFHQSDQSYIPSRCTSRAK